MIYLPDRATMSNTKIFFEFINVHAVNVDNLVEIIDYSSGRPDYTSYFTVREIFGHLNYLSDQIGRAHV